MLETCMLLAGVRASSIFKIAHKVLCYLFKQILSISALKNSPIWSNWLLSTKVRTNSWNSRRGHSLVCRKFRRLWTKTWISSELLFLPFPIPGNGEPSWKVEIVVHDDDDDENDLQIFVSSLVSADSLSELNWSLLLGRGLLSTLKSSVTSWLDYFFNIWPFFKIKICPIDTFSLIFTKYKINPQPNFAKGLKSLAKVVKFRQIWTHCWLTSCDR